MVPRQFLFDPRAPRHTHSTTQRCVVHQFDQQPGELADVIRCRVDPSIVGGDSGLAEIEGNDG